jgi:hypothetical protein
MSTTEQGTAVGTGAEETWETVIGLEVHAELATRTKLFSGALNQFGSEPNTNIDPVTLGLPGSLPVLNEHAVELAIRVGLALHCSIEPSVFARKNYFYPDMPKDFQISQYDQPIDVGGWLELADGTRVGITRAHLEEDTGKNTHVGGSGRIGGAEHSLVDYNRAGVPLLEIVSEPDLRSAEAAKAYVEELRSILVAIGASDGKMEEGSLRVDANVSPGSAVRDPVRDQERELAALVGPGHRVRDGPPDRGHHRRGADPPGDPALGRGQRAHHPGAFEGGCRGLPLLPRTRPRPGRARRRVDRTDPRRPAAPTGGAPACPGRGVRRGPHRRRGGGGRASRPAPTPPGCSPTSSTTWRSKGPRPSAPAPWPRW